MLTVTQPVTSRAEPGTQQSPSQPHRLQTPQDPRLCLLSLFPGCCGSVPVPTKLQAPLLAHWSCDTIALPSTAPLQGFPDGGNQSQVPLFLSLPVTFTMALNNVTIAPALPLLVGLKVQPLKQTCFLTKEPWAICLSYYPVGSSAELKPVRLQWDTGLLHASTDQSPVSPDALSP